MNIKAAVARNVDRPLVIEGLDLDDPRADEIVVRLVACGLSTSDLQAIRGDLGIALPFVPGCEGAGIVEHVGGDVTGVATGDAVILSAAALGAAGTLSGRRADGSSPFSKGGRSVGGFFMGQSSLATHLVCPAAFAIRLPVGAPLEVLAPLGGAMLESACAILSIFDIGPGDSLVVTGAGASGLLAVMLAKARGAASIAIADPDEMRRSLATELGATIATHTVEDLATVVRSMAAEGARYALETTGRPEALRACVDSLGKGGVCARSDAPTDAISDFDDRVSEGDAAIVAASSGLDATVLMTALAALQATGDLPIDRLVTFFPFEFVNDALEAFREERVIKAVVRFSLGAFGDLDRAMTEGAASEAPSDAAPEVTVPSDAPEEEREKVSTPTARSSLSAS